MGEKLSNDVLDELIKNLKDPKELESLYSQMLQRLINRSLDGEMDAHLGYEKNARQTEKRRANTRNGKSRKAVQSTYGELEIETPRDRDGSFEPQLVQKRQVRLTGMALNSGVTK